MIRRYCDLCHDEIRYDEPRVGFAVSVQFPEGPHRVGQGHPLGYLRRFDLHRACGAVLGEITKQKDVGKFIRFAKDVSQPPRSTQQKVQYYQPRENEDDYPRDDYPEDEVPIQDEDESVVDYDEDDSPKVVPPPIVPPPVTKK